MLRAAGPARRPAVSAASASRLLLGHRPFPAPSPASSRSRYAAAVAAGVRPRPRPRPRRPRLSVVAMAGNGERATVWRYLLCLFQFFFFLTLDVGMMVCSVKCALTVFDEMGQKDYLSFFLRVEDDYHAVL